MNDIMKKVTAIIRMKQLEAVERELSASGVSGITVTSVKGFGEWRPQFYFGYTKTINQLVGHVRLEVFVDADKAESLVETIVRNAFTGEPGDGIIAVLPVDQFNHIRTHGAQSPDAPDTSSGTGRSNS